MRFFVGAGEALVCLQRTNAFPHDSDPATLTENVQCGEVRGAARAHGKRSFREPDALESVRE